MGISSTNDGKYSKTFKGKIAKYFRLKNEESETFYKEIFGGLTMYLVSIYILQLNQFLQGGSVVDDNYGNITTSGYEISEWKAIPSATAITAGLSTILMGVLGGVPLICAPGVTYGTEFGNLASKVSSSNVLASNMIIGSLLCGFAFISKYARPISSLPEDFRLGVAAGIGAFLSLVGLWNCSIIQFNTIQATTEFSYQLVLALLGFLILTITTQYSKISSQYAFALQIIIITIISVIIRAALNESPIGNSQISDNLAVSQLTGSISINNFKNNEYSIAFYIIWNLLNKIIDLLCTITAVILLACITRLGYNKQMFHKTLKESRKCQYIYLADALANLIISPLIGTGLTTPFSKIYYKYNNYF